MERFALILCTGRRYDHDVIQRLALAETPLPIGTGKEGSLARSAITNDREGDLHWAIHAARACRAAADTVVAGLALQVQNPLLGTHSGAIEGDKDEKRYGGQGREKESNGAELLDVIRIERVEPARITQAGQAPRHHDRQERNDDRERGAGKPSR